MTPARGFLEALRDFGVVDCRMLDGRSLLVETCGCDVSIVLRYGRGKFRFFRWGKHTTALHEGNRLRTS